MKRILLYLIALSAAVIAMCSHALPHSTFSLVDSNNTGIKLSIAKLPDEKGFAPIKQVTQLSADHWQIYPSNKIKVNRGSNWLKLEVKNVTQKSLDTHIVIDGRQFIYQHIIYQRNTQLYTSSKQLNNIISTQVTLLAGERKTLYVKIGSFASRELHISALNHHDYAQFLSQNNFISGAAIGGLIALMLTLLLIFLATLNYAIAILALYVAALAGNLAAMYGVNFSLLLPVQSNFHGLELPIFTSLAAVSILWFSSELFQLAIKRPLLNWAFMLGGASFIAFIGASFFLSFNDNLFSSNLVQVISALLLAILSVHLYLVKHPLTTLFSVLVVLQVMVSVLNIAFYGWHQLNTQLYSVSYWLTGLLIIFILGRQSSHEKRDKYAAQLAAMANAEQSRKAQEELLALQNENQEQLELAVQERTIELNIALQELEEVNRELALKNTQDELTGLYNRRYYEQKLLAEYRRSRRNLTPLSMVVLDIDHFKSVNDTYGHSAGDICLVTLAQLIKQTLRRSSDIGCRFGGEEFCMILPETDSAGALAIAEELRKKVATTHFYSEDQQISLSISCGVTTYQQQADVTPQTIFKTADQALYLAKHQGRNQVVEKAIANDAKDAS